MKCTSCGLPLSPTRTPTNCPRCGTPTDESSTIAQPHYQPAYWGTSGVVDAGGPPPPNYQWAQNVQDPSAYSPPRQSGQMWFGQVYQPESYPSPPPPGSHKIK